MFVCSEKLSVVAKGFTTSLRFYKSFPGGIQALIQNADGLFANIGFMILLPEWRELEK